MDKKNRILQQLKNGLIVSCQALEGEPMYSENGGIIPLFAIAAMNSGACAIRSNSVRDIIEIKKKISLPIIGIIKKQYLPYRQHITVTMKEIDELMACGTDIIALDCTLRTRPDGLTPNEFVNMIKEKYPDCLLMADISNYAEGISVSKSNIDFIGTTLSGYTSESEVIDGPDFDLVSKLVKDTKVPIIAEGRIHYPNQAKTMLIKGAYAVVVGGAITRPAEITKRFIDEMTKEK